jgi:hypothetical protein
MLPKVDHLSAIFGLLILFCFFIYSPRAQFLPQLPFGAEMEPKPSTPQPKKIVIIGINPSHRS